MTTKELITALLKLDPTATREVKIATNYDGLHEIEKLKLNKSKTSVLIPIRLNPDFDYNY